MKKIRELKAGEKGKYYNSKTHLIQTRKKFHNNIIVVDENDFIHSINDEPGYIYGIYTKLTAWYNHGYLHRLTGPAYYWSNGNEIRYFISGKEYTQEEFEVERNRLEMLNDL